ncbi:MAG: hypothetical protein JNM81_00165 [Rhodospirillaceae bacterium]|nr:hypothetical protein [Rhodospirillaceae bacterium]
MARLTKSSRTKVSGTAAEKEAKRMAAEIVMIADDAAGDYVVKKTAKSKVDKAAPEKILDRSAIARAKLRIDVRMWLMVRLAPHIYGVPAVKPSSRSQSPQPFHLDIDLDPDPDA